MGLFTRTYTLRWEAPSADLEAVATQIHEAIRAGVLAKVAANDSVPLVSNGVASPPGPVRLILEDRRRGLPGRRFRAILARSATRFELTIRCSRLRPLPLDLLEPVRSAVAQVASGEPPAWIVT